ncbi:MAG: DegV family protein [Eubacteriales bacterium]|nr:DegV family protein [Sarcina sp.]MDO4417087.1 DegV family protein [Eubacteriales bacterium]
MGKKNSYELYIDASVDIEQRYLEENDIHIIPMEYTVDDQVYVMDRPQTEEELHVFYGKMRKGSLTGTSQITPYTYEKYFREAAEAGRSLLYICLSSGLSSTYASSLTAAAAVKEDYPEVQIECVDSLGATGGMGLLLLLAIRNREAGMSLMDNAAFLRAHALDMGFWFMVEDLVYLKRGGRISAAAALAGNVLNLKPILQINREGKLVNISKQRGVPRALKYMVDCYEKAHDDTLGSDVVIAHADCRERAEKLADEVRRINPDARIQICPMGPVIGAHTGPGFAAVIHFGKRELTTH